ncbi:phage integrase family protein [Thermosinus carboxydivorans Nor1]|uniref:Phage integrase family protein n=1 Tax=Thermosinus carboxydivorans Nor1 TaxID=401526 RepID=A1HTM7_9FIRM|nr:site-specific integrase [Thermosinus carboxydivorans]EAX46638.1 phage integrase family protein [Thermosinus carboxydivorans Nor1]
MGKRRAKGEGSIYQRNDGLWVAAIVVGRNADTGKPVRKVVYARTKAEAKQKRDALAAQYEAAYYVDADKITVGDWLAKWLDVYARPAVAPSTYDWYERICRVHLIPAIGHLRLSRLQQMAVQQLLNSLVDAGKSARTVQAVHSVLAMALRVARKHGLLRTLPTDDVAVPQVRKQDKRPLTPDEWDALLTAAQTAPDIFAALVVEWATGLRRGELLGLMWDDIDFDRCLINVRRAVQIRRGGCVLADPKTEATKRVLPVPKEVMQVLRAHRARQMQCRLAAGPAWQDCGLVFPTSGGTLYDPRNWSKRFARIAKAAGLDIGVHHLRHDLTSRIVAAGAPVKEAQYRLGHATVKMLLDVYAHRVTGGQDAITETIRASAPQTLKNCSISVAYQDK